MKKIYIAGKVTGVHQRVREARFSNAEKQLSAAGFSGINPLKLVKDPTALWEVAMKICIKSLVEADAVLVLPCAADSRGATLERLLAQQLKIPVVTQIDQLSNY